MARNFNLAFIATCAMLALIVWLPLRQSGECCSYDDIVKRQASSISLYHSQFNPTASAYKLAGFQHKKPEVLVVGSSRAMQFREAFFNKSFYNAGGVASGVAQLEDFVDRMIPIHRPSIVLIGIDLWWFSPKHPFAAPDYVATQNAPAQNLLRKYIALSRGLLKPHPARRLGLSSMDKDVGFGIDGSYYYNFSVPYTKDAKFHDTLERLKNGGLAFEKGDDYSGENLARFIKTVSKLTERGIQVVLFYPPFAPPVAAAMSQDPGYSYVREVKTALAKQFEVFDYTNPLEIGSNQCEFIDGFHGGDVTYARILTSIARYNTDVKNVLSSTISDLISTYEGHARVSNLYEQLPEIDFLDLGCKK